MDLAQWVFSSTKTNTEKDEVMDETFFLFKRKCFMKSFQRMTLQEFFFFFALLEVQGGGATRVWVHLGGSFFPLRPRIWIPDLVDFPVWEGLSY